jgi:hypothetical protein
MIFHRIFCSVSLLVLLASGAAAQEFRGTINGRVTDPSGTSVPNAKITVTNVATNDTAVVTTTENGDYTAPFVLPGRYSVAAEAKGFRKSLREGVEVRISEKVTADFRLEVGEVTESVTVTSEAPLIDQTTADRGGILDNVRITQLPVIGRNPINFMNLVPGVVFNGNQQFQRPFDNGDNINFSINGGLQQTNNFLLDGQPDNAITDTSTDRTRAVNNVAYIPTNDAVQEFRVMTNFYDSQYGRTSGGVINIATKAGSNGFHGTAYEFMRRYQLEANNISANAAGQPRYTVDPSGKNLGGHKLDQYGTVLTGPVWLPRLYNGKDKTFWMFGFENYKESAPLVTQASVPTVAERQGDFSGSGANVFNPYSAQVNPAFDPSRSSSSTNPQYIRTQFPNNQIPQSLWNPVGLAIMKSYPAPNFGAAGALNNNYLLSPNLSQDHFRNYIGRVDHTVNEKERLFFRYAHNRRDQFDNTANGFTGPGMDAQDPLIRLNDNAVVDSLTILNPNTILDIRLGYTRFIQAAYRTQVTGFDLTTLGFSPSFIAQRFVNQPPRIEVSGTNNWGARNPSQNTTNNISFQPSLSLVRGKHSIKTGLELQDFRPNARGGSFLWGAGDFAFDSTFTQQLPEFSNGTGLGRAALLLGIPNNMNSGATTSLIQNTPQLAFHWQYWGLYLQDDFRVSSRLTLNLGIRWDVEGSPAERYNRMNRGFAYYTPSPLASNPQVRGASPADCPACANLTGGLLFAGTGGQSRGAFNTKYSDIQPRLGAAFRLDSKTVLRGGIGRFFMPEAAYGGSAGFASNTPFVASTGGGLNAFVPVNTLSNPFPNGLIAPTGAEAGLNTFLGQSITFNNPNRQIPYVWSYSAGFQRQLPFRSVISVEYVGSRSHAINTNDNQAGGARNVNVPSLSQLALAQQNSTYFTQAVPNPFAGLLPGTSLNGATVPRSQTLVPYPQFGAVFVGSESVGRLWYDSLQINLEKRMSAGLVTSLAYTFSKQIEALAFLNNQDPRPAKTLANTDRPSRLALSGVYQLPFGRGQKFGGNVGRGWNQLIGGWEYNWSGVIQSGTALNLPGNFNLISDPRLSSQSFGTWFNTCTLLSNGTTRAPNAAHSGFTAGCTNPSWQQIANTSITLRSNPLRSPNLRNPWEPIFDMSVVKRFIIREGISGDFRFEAFNALNTVIRGGPNTDPNSTNFGLVSLGQSNFPRQVQLGFKFNF